jgi:hypothetical protein
MPPRGKKEEPAVLATDAAVVCGVLSLMAADLIAMPVIEHNRKWCVLAQDSTKVRLPVTVDGQTKLAEFQVNFSIQRSPVSDAEIAEVDKIDSQRTSAANEREEKERREREAAIRAAETMGRTSTIEAIKALNQMAAQGEQAKATAVALGFRS